MRIWSWSCKIDGCNGHSKKLCSKAWSRHRARRHMIDQHNISNDNVDKYIKLERMI